MMRRQMDVDAVVIAITINFTFHGARALAGKTSDR
jgi:hypothetical protein